MARGERINNPTIRLELTQAEAEALEVVLNHVGGTPSGRRGLIDNISNALIGAGIEDTSDDYDGVRGGITFVEEPRA
jgi:hypothetical protein